MRMIGTGMEEGRGAVSKVLFTHKVVGFDGRVNVFPVDSQADTHEHVLRTLDDTLINSHQVGTFKGLEAKVVVIVVTIVNDGRVQAISIGHDSLVEGFRNFRLRLASLGINVVVEAFNDSRELLRSFLLQIADGDASGQDGIVGVLSGQVGSGLGSQVIKFNGSDTGIDTGNDFLSDF